MEYFPWHARNVRMRVKWGGGGEPGAEYICLLLLFLLFVCLRVHFSFSFLCLRVKGGGGSGGLRVEGGGVLALVHKFFSFVCHWVHFSFTKLFSFFMLPLGYSSLSLFMFTLVLSLQVHFSFALMKPYWLTGCTYLLTFLINLCVLHFNLVLVE